MKFLIDQFRDFRIVFKYGISGFIAASTQIGVLAFLVERVRLSYLTAVVWAFVCSALVSFSLQKFWTFRDHSLDRVHFQIIQYVFLALTMLTLNVAFMYFFVDVIHLWYIFAQVLTVGVTAITAFLYNRLYIFSKEKIESSST